MNEVVIVIVDVVVDVLVDLLVLVLVIADGKRDGHANDHDSRLVRSPSLSHLARCVGEVVPGDHAHRSVKT